MKEIKAIIQPFMVEKVIDALAAIEALSARNPDFEAPAWRHHLLKFPHTVSLFLRSCAAPLTMCSQS